MDGRFEPDGFDESLEKTGPTLHPFSRELRGSVLPSSIVHEKSRIGPVGGSAYGLFSQASLEVLTNHPRR